MHVLNNLGHLHGENIYEKSADFSVKIFCHATMYYLAVEEWKQNIDI